MRRGRWWIGIAGLFGIAVALGACGRTRPPPDNQKADPAGAVQSRAAALISDQANNAGKTGFIWIAPVVPTTPGGFTTIDQTGAANALTIKVDKLFADNSTSAKTSFTGSGITLVTGSSNASFPGVTGPFYGANWTAGSTVASGETYRVSVQALSSPTRVLGVVDVQVVANATAAAAVDRTKFVPFIAGSSQPLPIVFRLESKDADGDGINDWLDNCVVTKNASQQDSDGDGIGDACQCLNVPNGTACSTGCKSGQTCQSGTCSGGTALANGTACSTGNLCKQGETCTSGACGGGGNKTTGTACTTGNPCKQSETCTSGTCGGGSNKTTGTTCTTGNPCKQSETCTSGTCGGGSNKTTGTACSTTGNQCQSGQTCSSTGTCTGTAANKANGTACGDGNLCTQTDTCQAGTCTGASPLTCPSDTCHSAGSCNKTLGVCPARLADGTSCSDGNACTQTDTCQAGTCTGGTTVTCTTDQCHTIGACVPASGCPAPVAKANGTSCDDGNACTQSDTCQAGACTGGGAVTCTADQCHTVGACVPASGCPAPVPKSNGTSCNDGNTCTQSDTCQAGTCTGTNPVTCTALDQCHSAGTCNGTTGLCSNPSKPAGNSCNDGSAQDVNLALHQLATQSNTAGGGVASLAVDGVTTGDYNVALGTVAGDSTNIIDRPWWQVDLGGMDWITSVTLWNRTDCCTSRDADLFVFVSDIPFTSDDLATTQAQPGIWQTYVANQLPRSLNIPVNRSGRYVRVQMNHKDTFYLAEAQVMGRPMRNLSQGALAEAPVDGQATVQQSGQGSSTSGPERAVDANTDADPAELTFAQLGNTGLPPNPWWQVDLGADDWITEVKLWNYGGPENADNTLFYVLVSETPFASTDLAATQAQAGVWTSPLVNAVLPRSLTVPVNRKGRYVRIQKSNQQTMYLAEVQVLQVTDVNLALGMAASQAATCAWGPANLAVDGNTDGNPSDGSVTCAGDALNLAGVPNPWWQVDLGSRRLIKDIQIWNADTIANFRNFDFYVFVSDTPFQSTDLTTTRNQAGMWQTYWGPVLPPGATVFPVGRTGRYVRIQMNHQDSFYLAEVEVMGYGTDDLDDCPAADQCHTVALRDPQTGLCPAPVALANGAACDDGNACTQGDTCQAGACAPGAARTCPGDQCHAAGACDPATGYCTIGNAPLANGTACDDGNRCSVGDACQAGTCTPGPTTGCTAPTDAFYPPVTSLGSLQGSSQAQDINQAGVVIGADATGSGAPSAASGALAKGFHWNEAGGMIYVPAASQLNVYPKAINSAGTIVGTGVAATGVMSPVRYDPTIDTQFQPIGVVGQALNINDPGQITGIQTWIEGNRTFRLTGSVTETLPQLAGATPSEGHAIDSGGTIVGATDCTALYTPGCLNTGTEAVRFTGDADIEDLNDLLSPTDAGQWILRSANATNGTHIVGWAAHQGLGRAFRLTPGAAGAPAVVLDLGILPQYPPGAANTVIAHDINTAGDTIVGAVYDAAGLVPEDAFVWVAGTGMIGLNDLVDPAAGWHLVVAYGLNDSRDVVGMGTLDGQYRAFKMRVQDMSPCPADQCHAAAMRDPRTGTCPAPVALADGRTCTDGNACTTGETCQSGTCSGGTAMTCGDTCHTAGACVPATGCLAPVAKADGTTCDDGNICTQSETCQAGSCQASTTYPTVVNLTVDDLGTLGGSTASAFDINASGLIVGQSATASQQLDAFIRPRTAPTVDLGTLASGASSSTAAAVNDTGFATGSIAKSDGSHVFRYGTEGGILDFGLVGDGSIVTDQLQVRGAYGYDINDSGQMAGLFTNAGEIRGYRYTDGVGFEDVGSLGGTATYAYGIDTTGTVVGGSRVTDSPTTGYERQGHAFKFDDVLGLVDLNTYVDPTSGLLLVNASNVSGDYVVGGASRAGLVRAFRMRLSRASVEEIPSGWEGPTFAQATNSVGDTVGWGFIDAAQTQQAAFIYSDRLGFKKLNDLIDGSTGWDLRAVSSINDSDEVVGSGFKGGQQAAFHLNLSPQALACNQQAGTCGGPTGSVCVWADGIVDMGGGNFTAVFGYQNSSTTAVTPAQNEEGVDGTVVTNPQPAPPPTLAPGAHPAGFLPVFASGHTVSWTVNGQVATASSALPVLPEVPTGDGGFGVVIDGNLTSFKSGRDDAGALTPIGEGIATVGTTTYAVFSYTNPDTRNINLPYGSDNVLSDTSGAITNPSPSPPVWFLPGTQEGVLAYPLNGSLTWTLGTQSATLTTASPQLQVVTEPSGAGVFLGGHFFLLVPNRAGEFWGSDFAGSISTSEATSFGSPLPASFAVGPDGAATATVPIWVPPGRAGVQPEIALAYDSHHTTKFDGLGPGWRVQGLSQISRCSKNLVRDGQIAEVTFTDDGNFCLDGDLLVYQGGGDPANGSYDGASYRTEHDRFAVIYRNEPVQTPQAAPNPQSFTVYLKDGRVLEYAAQVAGSTTIDDFIGGSPLPQTTNTGPYTSTYAWSLSSMSDLSGNTVNYSYKTTINNDRDQYLSSGDEPCVEQHIDTITYGRQLINFHYSPALAPDTNRLQGRMFVSGFCMENTLKMTSIDISGPRPETGHASPEYLKHYVLTVKSEGLTSVVEEDSSGVPTTKMVGFTYENASPVPAIPDLTPVTVSNVTVNPPPTMNRSSFFQPFPNTFFATGDVNGDGFDDLVYYVYSAPPPADSPTTIVVQLSNGGKPGLPAFADPIPAIVTGPFNPPVPIQLVDADMDGKADVIMTANDSPPIEGTPVVLVDTIYFHSEGIDPNTGVFTVTGTGISTLPFSEIPIVADLDGDGLPEMVVGDSKTFHLFPNDATPFSGVAPVFHSSWTDTLNAFTEGPVETAGRFVSRQATSLLAATDSTLTRLAPVTGYNRRFQANAGYSVPYATQYIALDLNGDGLSDLVSVDPHFGQVNSNDHTRVTPTVFINTGAGFRARDLRRLPNPVDERAMVSSGTPLAVIDLNKDGLDDLLVLANDPTVPIDPNTSATGWYYPSDGNTLLPPTRLTSILDAHDVPFRVLDYNGDGRPDILTLATGTVNGNTTYTVKVYQNNQPRQLLVGMFGGLNDTPNLIQYDSVGNAERNSPGATPCTSHFPIYCPPIGPMVVTNTQYTNRDFGEQGLLETYTYSGAQMDLRGRGWLGVQNRRVVRILTDSSQEISVHDTHYAVAPEYGLNGSSVFYYDFPTAQRPDGDIMYYINHGAALANTATAVSVGTVYTHPTGRGYAEAMLPGTVVTKKRTVFDLDQILASMSLAFDPNQWPTSGATDIIASQRVTQYGISGDAFNEQTTTILSDGTEVNRAATSHFLNIGAGLFSQPVDRTVTETTPQEAATRSWVFTPDPTTGLLNHQTYQPGVPDEQLDTDYVRNTKGQPITVTESIASGESRTTRIVYDDFDGTFPKQVTNALGQTTTLTYHPGFGALVNVRDPSGLSTARVYDDFGRLRLEHGPDGTGFQVHYEDPDLSSGDARLGSTQVYQVHTIADSGAETKVVYDVLNRETVRSQKDFTGTSFDAINTVYDPNNIGLPALVTVPSTNPSDPGTPASTLGYDSMGRPTSVTLPDGASYAYTYGTDASWSVTGPEGQSSSAIDDGRGLLIARSDFVMKPGDSSGHTIGQTYKYGPFGTLTEVDVQNGPTTKTRYDASGRQIELDDPDTGQSTFKWNGFGDLVQQTDGNRQVQTYYPDALGRVQQMVTADGTTTYEWDTAANGIGRLANTTSSDDVDCAYGYDAAGRPSSQTWTLRSGIAGVDGTYTVGIGYDSVGRPSSITYPAVAGQAPLGMIDAYAPNGAPSGVVRASDLQAVWTVNSRNERGQITSETAGNGVGTTHVYPAATGLLREVTSTLGDQVLRDLVYDYDGVHRVKQRTTDGETVEKFQYDTIDRLVDWQTGAADGSPHTAYTYDDLGNLTLAQQTGGGSTSATTFTPGDGITHPPHQIASSSLGTFLYDARGNQYAAPGRTVSYTAFGLPKSITTGAGATSFAYDGSQARVLKVNGDGVVVSLGGIFERRIQSGQATDVFYAIGGGGPVAQILWQEVGSSVNEVVQYLHDDHIQSIEAVTDATGQVVTRERFDPFGSRMSTAPAGVRVGYQGAEEDDDVGLVNMNGRIYDPAQFRFITADPFVPNVFLGQDLNRYAFVRNSPLNYRDPSGFDDAPPGAPQQGDPEQPGSHLWTYTGSEPILAYGTNGGYEQQGLGWVTPGLDDGTPTALAGVADGNGTNTPSSGSGLGGVPIGTAGVGRGSLLFGAPGEEANTAQGGNPSSTSRDRYIAKALDLLARPTFEQSTFFYHVGRTMGNTGAHSLPEDDPDRAKFSGWASGDEAPGGAIKVGEGHAHPTAARYRGQEAGNLLRALSYDIGMSVQHSHTTSWVRFTTGEIVRIDTSQGWINEVRGPTDGSAAVLKEDMRIPGGDLAWPHGREPRAPE